MCFTVTDKKEYIAEKDITCYKVMRKSNRGFNILTSQFLFFEYKIGNTYKLNKSLKIKNIHGFSLIKKGFHSYINLFPYSKYNTLVKCIIPKGATYYKNALEYVSDEIKIIEIVKKYGDII